MEKNEKGKNLISLILTFEDDNSKFGCKIYTLTIHLYALCWNEADMLPYFFRHYDPFVTAYFIYDDGSTDSSVELLKAHPKTTVASITVRKNLAPPGPENPGISFFEFYNSIWKQSIGKADYVILCNIDELFYHPDMNIYLRACKQQGVTVVPSIGYSMFSLTFPRSPLPLHQLVNKGIHHNHYNKPFLFNPNKIIESGFHGGRHKMDPEGEVVYPDQSDVKLLHYFFIGLWRELKRKRKKGKRLKNFHREYSRENQSIVRQLHICYKLLKNAKKVI